jgi:hypothetical protein
LLTETYSRPAAEGHVRPSRPDCVPAFGLEFVRVGAVDVGAAVHGVAGITDQGAGGDRDGGLACGPAADGKDGVFEGGTEVDGDNRMEA